MRKAVHRKYGYSCAIKLIKKDFVDPVPRKKQSIMNEMRILEQIRNPNILRSYEFLHDEKYYFIVTELVQHGDLFNYYCGRQEAEEELFDEHQIKVVAKQLFSALDYLHSNHIFHRDVKLENVLLEGFVGKEPVIRLSDYGFSIKLNDNESPKDRVGSNFFMAPELISHHKYGFKADIWAAIVTLYSLVHGSLPFYGETFKELKDEILTYDMSVEILNDASWEHMSIQAKDFFVKGFRKNPKHRPSASEMLNHPWLQDVQVPESVPDVPTSNG